VQVDGVKAVERRHVGGRVIHLCRHRDARVVDQDVQSAETGRHVLHQFLHLRGIGLVGLDGGGSHPQLFQATSRLGGFAIRGRVAEGHVGAFGGHGFGDGGTDSARSAGHQSDLALERLSHWKTPNSVPIGKNMELDDARSSE